MNVQRPTGEESIKKPFLYVKRNGNLFYFKNDYLSFSVTLEGKELFDFVDNYDVGDTISFKV